MKENEGNGYSFLIEQPPEGGNLPVNVMGGCAGDGEIFGKATKAGFTMAAVKVLVRPGTLASIPPNDVVQYGLDAAWDFVSDPMNPHWKWSIMYPTMPCKGGECDNGANTIGVEMQWERFADPADPTTYEAVWEPLLTAGSAETVRFTADCRFTIKKGGKYGTAKRVGLGWQFLNVDLNHGSLIGNLAGSSGLRSSHRLLCASR